MFDENGCLMVSYYWCEDMNGVDWDSVFNCYCFFVDLCYVVDDFYDIFWEMVVEFNILYFYVLVFGVVGDLDMCVGFLGVDVSSGNDGVKVVWVIFGELLDFCVWLLLWVVGVVVIEGDVIVVVDGWKVGVDGNFGEFLEGLVGWVVELMVC